MREMATTSPKGWAMLESYAREAQNRVDAAQAELAYVLWKIGREAESAAQVARRGDDVEMDWLARR